ncbi:hypothetical protein M3Y99_01501900 [Aphelenchoides fujianensis]|nr:hypothetical protein M3Y99_01501900 [Aphelenchoides fujianensis]
MPRRHELCLWPHQFDVLRSVLEWRRYEDEHNSTTIRARRDGRLLVLFRTTKKRSFRFLPSLEAQLLTPLLERKWRLVAQRLGVREWAGLAVFFRMAADFKGPLSKVHLSKPRIAACIEQNDFYFKPNKRPNRAQKRGESHEVLLKRIERATYEVRDLFREQESAERRVPYRHLINSRPLPWFSQLPVELKFRVLEKLVALPTSCPRRSSIPMPTIQNCTLLPLRAVDRSLNQVVDCWMQQTKRSFASNEYMKMDVLEDGGLIVRLGKSNARMEVDSLFFSHVFDVSSTVWLAVHLAQEREHLTQLVLLERMFADATRQPKNCFIYATTDGDKLFFTQRCPQKCVV